MGVAVRWSPTVAEDVFPTGSDWVVDEAGTLAVYNGSITAEGSQEIATYPPNQWMRVVVSVPPSPPT